MFDRSPRPRPHARAAYLALLMAVGCASNNRTSSSPANGCAPTDVCFNVRAFQPRAPILSGMVQVYWSTPDREPELAYSKAFSGRELSFFIPLSEVSLPSERQRQLVYERDTNTGEYRTHQIAVGYVVLIIDRAPDGTSLANASLKNRLGGGAPMALGFSTGVIQNTLQRRFPGGMARGIAAYVPVRPPGSMFDSLQLAYDQRVFDFAVCSYGYECPEVIPNFD